MVSLPGEASSLPPVIAERSATRRWGTLAAALVLTCPVAFYAAYALGLICSLGWTPGAVAEEILLVVAAGTLIWRRRPDERRVSMRVVTVAAICASLALGGASAVHVVYMFSDPAWDF